MRKYPPEVREIVWALLCSRVKPKEIRRRLAEGDAELDTLYEMPESSFFEMRRSLIKERGRPEDQVLPGREVETIEALERRALQVLARSLSRIEKRETDSGDLSPADRQAAIQLAKALKELKPKVEPAPNSHQARGSKGTPTRDRSPLALLAKRERQTGQDLEAVAGVVGVAGVEAAVGGS